MQNTTIAVAPVVGVQGTKTHGGHVLAWRACPAFATTSTLALVAGTANPWRPGTPGHGFYNTVLAPMAAGTTVAQLLVAAAAAGYKATAAQGHLRWLYTWGGAYLQVNGLLYGQQAPATAPATAPAAPASKLLPKAKGKGKVAA